MTYIEKLKNASFETGNCACMGLDPVVTKLPEGFSITSFFEKLFKEMKRLSLVPSAFKPNIGYYTILDKPFDGDFKGSSSLAKVILMIREIFPNIPIILDSKRGDIATSSLNYATEAFKVWEADAVTVSPYMGSDSVLPFSEYAVDKGVYLLNRTSNPGGKDLQNLLDDKSEPFYIDVSRKVVDWKTGAVVGATNLMELKNILDYFANKDVPVLIPGVGSQGGSAEEVMDIIKQSGYNSSLARINSSSAITHPWAKKQQKAPVDWIDWSLDNLSNLIEGCKC